MTAVSIVIPLKNGARFIRETLRSIWAQEYEPIEVILVDDGSSDGGVEIARSVARNRPIIVVAGDGNGAAAALNTGLRYANHPIVCQVDQDVVLEPDWIARLVERFDADDVAAVQGVYVTDPSARLLSRVMNRDLEERYAALGSETDHVCTGNVAYRLSALQAIGLFDESLGYGYDNDVSYRLKASGYRLLICREARSLHRWRDDVAGYFRQQYGFGYGRIDLVAKYPHRAGGDAVSPTLMMLHPLILAAALLAVIAGFPVFGLLMIAALLAERAVVGIRAARRFEDLTPLWFPVVHLVRDLAWVCAITMWMARHLLGTGSKPAHSMRQRPVPTFDFKPRVPAVPPATASTLLIVPAFNEAGNLRAVVSEMRRELPHAELLVVDDGSTDDTEEVVNDLGVRWIRLPEQMGIGSAMRVGLRYARRQQFTFVARLDGDGQHRARDVRRLLRVVREGGMDIAFGSRLSEEGKPLLAPRFVKRTLAACLTILTGRRVGDATCGLCAMGPRAIRLLAEYHPTGYPEPELRLMVSRTALAAVEIDVDGRPRLTGKTSLTPLRLVGAAARVALAMCVVPLRRGETEPAGE